MFRILVMHLVGLHNKGHRDTTVMKEEPNIFYTRKSRTIIYNCVDCIMNKAHSLRLNKSEHDFRDSNDC